MNKNNAVFKNYIIVMDICRRYDTISEIMLKMIITFKTKNDSEIYKILKDIFLMLWNETEGELKYQQLIDCKSDKTVMDKSRRIILFFSRFAKEHLITKCNEEK